MLFLGSFVLARAMCVHGLDQRLAYSVLSVKSIAAKKTRILFALGLTSMFLSLWISNTATTAMMYPIALGVLDAFRENKQGNNQTSFSVVFLLSLAYSASIGGIGTPIGSPPNLIAIGMLERLVDYRVTFFQWMIIGFLIMLPMYFVLFFLMKWKMRKHNGEVGKKSASFYLADKVDSRLTRAQRNVLIAFSVTVFLWVFPGFVSLVWGRDASLYLWFHDHFPESVAAIIGASLLFFLPVKLQHGQFTLSLKEALHIDWGTLLLFGGGLSLGFQMFETGLADAIGKFFISIGGDSASLTLITLLSVTFSVFLTELTSNTASASMIIPIIIAISNAASISPLPPVLGASIGCSFAFMLPVATPPNAIIYGSGMIRLPQMMRIGLWLNLSGIIIIWLVVRFLATSLNHI
jgi:sodium-dependent dicarboxylate transporter 2/3/5